MLYTPAHALRCQQLHVEMPLLPTPDHEPSSETSQIPSLLRVLDANLQPQPHHLSPLAERDEQSNYTRSRSQLSLAHSVPSSSSSSSPTPSCYQACVDDDNNDDEPRHSVVPSCPDQVHISRPRTNTQRTRETDPYPFSTPETLGLQTARLLPVQCVARADVRCGEVTIPRRCGGGTGGVGEGCGLARRSSGRGAKRRLGSMTRKAWGKIKGLLCRSWRA